MVKDSQSSLRELVNFGSEITLIPYSGIQMLDFGFNLEGNRLNFPFMEQVIADTTATDENPANVFLHSLTSDDDENERIIGHIPLSQQQHYSVNERQALAPFLRKWVPIPVLRLRKERGEKGEERYDQGPSTWARARTVELSTPVNGHSHRLQIALDTSLVDNSDTDLYLAPGLDDSRLSREFRFVTGHESMSWFLHQIDDSEQNHQQWVADWISHLQKEFLDAGRRNRPVEPDAYLEAWARYLSYIRLIDHLVPLPLIRLADTISEYDRVPYVDVDLVLDIGNSRTCGILVEKFPGDSRVDLTQSYPLSFRNLSNPEIYYSGLVPSRVEFAETNFGEDRFSSASGRRNAYLWPSFVRIGYEAIELIESEDGNETISGLSSPKRYLWDDQPMPQDWRFHNQLGNDALPRGARASMQFLNEPGDVIAQVEYEEAHRLRPRGKTSKERTIRPRFSRSALFGFMLSEIISHAMVQINDCAARIQRKQSDLPRRLKQIIITLPTATPIQEQSILRSRAQGALELIWQRMLKAGQASAHVLKPELKVDWDEASCSQMVFLYNEVTQKFGGRIQKYFELTGKPRPRVTSSHNATGSKEKEPSLRVCSVDIGGGTTDVMVITYFCDENRLIVPHQNFREGFRIAGDDIVARMISVIVLPAIIKSVEQVGGRGFKERLSELFGGDVGGQAQQIAQLRCQFSLRVLAPIAVEILGGAEKAERDELINVSALEVIGSRSVDKQNEQNADNADTEQLQIDLPDTLRNYIEDTAGQCNAPDWRLADFQVSVPRKLVDKAVADVIQHVLGCVVEVASTLNCDVILLTGRPSRLPAVRSIIENACLVGSDRLIQMHDYRTSLWYPFREASTHKIGDPKTTVAVGGMLLALAENRINNFSVTTSALHMKSTVRFIGEMEMNDQINNNKIMFGNVSQNEAVDIKMYGPIYIGSRQLPMERWIATPLYRLDFVSPDKMKGRTPLTVSVERCEFDDDPQSKQDVLRSEALKEAFEITSAEDKDGSGIKVQAELQLRLHTLGANQSYWLDTGVFFFN